MVNALRSNLLDSNAPNPSVETLLHAFLPHKFVDHTHSVAAIALADQPDAEAACRRAFGGRVACVPYAMPGFQLAKLAAEVYEANPEMEGLVLLEARPLFIRIDGARVLRAHDCARHGGRTVHRRKPASSFTADETSGGACVHR